ncbi:MAG: carboxymuconolactone decarboxylase family protein [Bdellovibrio sp.]
MKLGIVLALVSLFCGLSSAAELAERTKILNEIRSTFGTVPTFMKEFPEEGLPGAWEEFKALELSTNTALDGKTKELIGLAVASTIPCRYCTYFHKKSATLNGAKPEDIKLALSIAALETKWATFFEGNQMDVAKVKPNFDKMISFRKTSSPTQAKNEQVPQGAEATTLRPMDAKAAYKDMENTMGFVPDFMKMYPEASVAGAWNEIKDIQFNSKTLSSKTKDLIALAVSSQIPSAVNVYADTEFAKSDGATPQEIQEAIALASQTRHWSTFLNGLRQDEKAFEREVDQMMKFIQKSNTVTPKKVSLGK